MTVRPASTIGIIGGGQLGRMLGIAAAQLGYKCHIFDPHERPWRPMSRRTSRAPASTMPRRCARSQQRSTSRPTNSRICRSGRCEVLGEKLRPGARSLAVAQDRAGEKQFIEECGARVAPWRQVSPR